MAARASSAGGTTTVLYIGGESRSGSTVLSAILGSYEDMVSIGELRTVWQALKTNQLCGCGEPMSSCQFWVAVGDCAYGGWQRIDVDTMISADRRSARHRAVARHIVNGARRANPDLKAHRAILARLYDAIGQISGSRLIVDSTKDPSYAYVLRDTPGIDLRVVNLVRDSRGVAYSNAKARIVRPELAQDSSPESLYMPTWPLWRTAVSWEVKNLLFYLLIQRSKRQVVKYEDVVAHPREELSAIREFAGADRCDNRFWDQGSHSFELLPHHTLGGNPVRFGRGRVRLAADDEWQRRMRGGDKMLVTAITLPLLVAYGYLMPRKGTELGSEDSRADWND